MDNLSFYTGYTLADITATGVTRMVNDKQRNQQRNWETILQTIGLKAQPLFIDTPVCSNIDVSYFNFGEMYSGKQNIWMFNFAVEHAEVFKQGNDEVAMLHEDFNQIPFTVGLDETTGFILPIFYTSGAIKNIYFKVGRLDLNNI